MDKKFTDFPLVGSPNLSQIKVVGLDELGQNAQFNGADFGGGSGDVTGANNIGTGEGIALPTQTGTIPMKTLKVTGAGVISSDADSITINVQSSNNVRSGSWTFETPTTNVDPGNGFFRLNQADFATPTELYLSKFNEAGVDTSTIVGLWAAGDKLYIQDAANASSAVIYTIAATPVLTGGTYFVVSIVWSTNGGGAFFGNNTLCVIEYSQAGGATAAHGTLTGRDDPNQHIAAAVSVTPSGLLTTQLQTSLNALDSGKAPTVHTHTVSSITNLDPDAATLTLPANTTITSYIQPLLASTSSATANAAIGSAPTAAGQPVGGTAGQVLSKIDGTNYNSQWITPTVVTVTDTATIDLTMTGQALTAAVVANSIGSAQLDSATDASLVLANSALQPTIVNAKGDLISASAADVPAILTAGPNGRVLSTNSATATGLEWIVPTAGGSPITIQEDGTPLTTAATLMNFVGAELTEPVANQITIDVQTPLNTKVTALSNRAPNEAVLVICLGDSNMQSANTANPAVQSANTNVWVRASDGIAPNQNPATDLTWRNVDPNGTAVADNPGFPNVYWGMIRGSHGTADWALADKLQLELDAPVYLVSVSCNSTTSAYWLPTGGVGMDSLELYLTTAINDITTSGTLPAGWVAPTKAHVVLWSEGANDVTGGLVPANAVAPQTFVDNMKTIRDFMIASGWITKKTLILNMNMSPTWSANLNNQWPGINYLDNQTDEYFRILSSRNKAVETDQLHYTPIGLNDFGRNAAEIALKGLQPKVYTAQGANNFVYAGLLKLANTGTSVNVGNPPVLTPFINITDNHSWAGGNGSVVGGLDLPPAVSFSGTHTITQPMEILTPKGSLFSNTAIFTTPSATAITFGAYPGLLHQPTMQSNGATFTITGVQSACNAQPLFLSSTGGATNITSVANYSSNISLGTAATGGNPAAITLTEFIGFVAGSPALNNQGAGIAPIITRAMGIKVFSHATAGNTYSSYIHLGASNGAGGNWGIYEATPISGTAPHRLTGTLVLGDLASASTIGNGNWAIYQEDNRAVRFNGALNTKMSTVSATTLTLDASLNNIYCTAATDATYSLPAPTLALAGRVYLVMNSARTGAAGNVTMNVVGGGASIDTGVATLQASQTIAAGATRRYQCSGDGSVWVSI